MERASLAITPEMIKVAPAKRRILVAAVDPARGRAVGTAVGGTAVGGTDVGRGVAVGASVGGQVTVTPSQIGPKVSWA